MVTPKLLVETLRQGEIALFEAMFSELSGVRLTLIRRLLFEPGGQALAVACRGLGIAPVFASIFLLSRKARHERAIEPGEATRVIGFYNRLNLQSATQLLKKWQRERDYLKAVWRSVAASARMRRRCCGPSRRRSRGRSGEAGAAEVFAESSASRMKTRSAGRVVPARGGDLLGPAEHLERRGDRDVALGDGLGRGQGPRAAEDLAEPQAGAVAGSPCSVQPAGTTGVSFTGRSGRRRPAGAAVTLTECWSGRATGCRAAPRVIVVVGT